MSADTFGREGRVDQVVNVAVAAYEGQLLGRFNQAGLLLTARSGPHVGRAVVP